MENNAVLEPVKANSKEIISPESLLYHWQGHRQLTRRVIEAFPEDKLFEYSVGGMRPFSDMAKEIMGLSATGIIGIVTNEWTPVSGLDYHSGKSLAKTKEELLHQWDKVTNDIDNYWPLITRQRLTEVVNAFGQWEGEAIHIIQYWIDNEIHHRAQGYVYLRSLGIEPPPFWDRG